MRAILILLIGLTLFSGCKTVEVAVTHPTTGLHFVARVESEPSVVCETPVVCEPQMVAMRLPAAE